MIGLVSDWMMVAMAQTSVVRSGDVVSESLRVIERRCLGPLTLDDVAAALVDRYAIADHIADLGAFIDAPGIAPASVHSGVRRLSGV